MNTRMFVGLGLACLMLTAAFAPAARASEMDHLTRFTFTAPVEVPGRVLPAGTYVFKLIDPDQNLVQIYNQNQNKVMATLFAVPDELAQTPSKPIAKLEEERKGTPQSIQEWYYPGDSTAEEFVYSKAG